MSTGHQIDLARAFTSFLLRGMWPRVDLRSIPSQRMRGLTEELTTSLHPIAIASRTTLAWARAVAERFEIPLTPCAAYSQPAWSLVPRKFMQPGMTFREAPVRNADGVMANDPDWVDVQWDVLCKAIDFQALRYVLHECAPTIVTFAVGERSDDDLDFFEIRPKNEVDTGKWRPVLPKTMVSPARHRTTWMCTGPMFHGADHKHGNVQLFRREAAVDPLTGAIQLRPFISGNAVRGAWRDTIFGRLLRLVDLKSTDMPAARAHALFSGGTIESGADTQRIDVSARRRARDRSPAWDLFAGCIDGQIMKGVLEVHDAVLVCRENAWMLHRELAPDVSYEEFAASLKPADDLTQLRLLTRHKHADFENADGVQMLVNHEIVLAGSQLFHSFSLRGLDAISPLAKSCMADLLEEFQLGSVAGAGNARGFGLIAFDAYHVGDEKFNLPTGDLYVDWVKSNQAEIVDWLMGAGTDEPGPEKPVKGPRGKKSGKQDVTPDAPPPVVDGAF